MSQQYRTSGDIVRELVQRQGKLYFADVEDDIRNRLETMPTLARKAFALACAEHLMRQHERLPTERQRPLILRWRPLLDSMWAGLADSNPVVLRYVQEALDAFQPIPYDQHRDPNNSRDANENAAVVSMYAAECYVGGRAQEAVWAAGRAIDAAFKIVDDELWLSPEAYKPDPKLEPVRLAEESMHPAVQAELRRQLGVLSDLERHGVTIEVLEKLRKEDASQ